MMFNHFDGAHVDIYIFTLYTFMANKYATAERIKLIKTIAFLVPIEICKVYKSPYQAKKDARAQHSY